jgi:hypothetical protein
MKVVFAGPSLHGADFDRDGIDFRPPAAHGDVLRAVLEGAAVIGIIDGDFEATASVWHKEILHALSDGVAVVGGASMGALRAAECADFGMEPVGEIAARYLGGGLDDDAAVAVTQGPPELGSPPLVEPLVDVEATIAAMLAAGAIDSESAGRLLEAARRLFFKRRTVEAIAAAALPLRQNEFVEAYEVHRVRLKQRDALAVVARVRELAGTRTATRPPWRLSAPPNWRRALDAVRFAPGAGAAAAR